MATSPQNNLTGFLLQAISRFSSTWQVDVSLVSSRALMNCWTEGFAIVLHQSKNIEMAMSEFPLSNEKLKTSHIAPLLQAVWQIYVDLFHYSKDGILKVEVMHTFPSLMCE